MRPPPTPERRPGARGEPLRRARFLLVSFAAALFLLAALEGALRLAGFHREAAPLVLRFGYPNPREITDLFEPDPRLFWRLRPGSVFEAESPVAINTAGYRGPLPAEPAPPGLVRIAVMGDSVAFGGATAWPEILATRLGTRLPGRRIEVLDFGVPGYTIVQGLRQFQDEVAPLSPGVVLIAYGWNDHWLARGGLTDSARRFPSAAAARAAAYLSRMRVLQAARALLAHLPEPRSAPPVLARVPPSEYAERIRAFIASARAARGVPIVLGLPAGMTEETVPEYLVSGGFAARSEDVLADHTRYLRIARESAAEQGVLFVDLGPSFRGSDGRPIASLFMRDGIHPSAEGHEVFAASIEAAVAAAAR